MSEVSNSAPAELTIESAADQLMSRISANADSDKQQEHPAGDKREAEPANEAADASNAEVEGADAEPSDDAESKDSKEQPEDPSVAPEAEKEKRYTIKVGDKEESVTESELKSGYMRTADYTRKTQEFAKERNEERQKIEAARTELAQRANEELTRVGFLADQLMQRVLQDEKNTNWEELRLQDPAEFAARKQEQENRKQLVAAAFNEYQASQSRAQQEAQQRLSESLPRFRAEQEEKLKSLIPEWVDDARAKREKPQIAAALKASGFDDDEISGLMDARMVNIARKAWLFDLMQQRKQEVTKKAEKPVPRVARGGAPGDGRHDKTQQAASRFRKSGDWRDAAEALLTRIEER